MRGRLIGVLVLAGLVVVPCGRAAVQAATPTATLKAGGSAFWEGAYVGAAEVSDASACGTSGPCFDYKLDVTAKHGKVLRVAIDSEDESNDWLLQLIDPKAKIVAGDESYQEGGLGERNDIEVFAHDPAPGKWTVRVIPKNVWKGSFSARAALDWTKPKAKHHERVRRGTSAVTDVLPDLAPDPPWHLTFDQPTPQVGPFETGSVTAIVGIHQPTATIGGQPVIACLPEETLELHAQRCLRFSSGVASRGPGRFEVYGSAAVPVAVNGGPLTQVIQRSDGSTRRVAAGQYSFHKVHLHYHVLALAQFPLFKVVGPNEMVPVGRGLKEGFCLGNIKLYDWRSFDADPVDPNTIDNCEPSAQPDAIARLAPDSWRFYEGIATGWEDVYTWATSGQFVDFRDPDGTYVLQMTINAEKHFLETDTSNDTGYTEFRVMGNDVRVLERGRGTSPWDPHKVLLGPDYTK